MKSITLLTAAAALMFAAQAHAGEMRVNPKAVVELFTSQGCSSCPKADALFAELGKRNDLIALAWHVDYWDYIGWPDTFGNPANSDRQRAYAASWGSSRDWAAKGTRLLGVRAVIAQSFERIHRSNLIGMGVLPLQFADGESWQSLGITGNETVTIEGLTTLTPRAPVTVKVTYADGTSKEAVTRCRIDTINELDYYRHGGILHYVLRNLVAA